MKTVAVGYRAKADTLPAVDQDVNRFAVSLDGVCSIDGGADVVCTANLLSLNEIVLRCRARMAYGSNIVFSLPQIGLLRGRVSEIVSPEVVVRFEGSRGQSRRVTNYLTWLIARRGAAKDRGARV